MNIIGAPIFMLHASLNYYEFYMRTHASLGEAKPAHASLGEAKPMLACSYIDQVFSTL